MANTLDPMDLQQIITLQLDGLSNRKIAQSLSILAILLMAIVGFSRPVIMSLKSCLWTWWTNRNKYNNEK